MTLISNSPTPPPMSAPRESLDRALELTGGVLELLAPMLATTADSRLLHLLAAVEAVGELQDRLYDLQDPA
jgi:hypothetical protein